MYLLLNPRPLYEHVCVLSRPSILFSSDEAVACRLATNEVQFFDPSDFSKGFVSRLKVPGVAAVQLSNLPGSHVATFVPESKVGVSELGCFLLGSTDMDTGTGTGMGTGTETGKIKISKNFSYLNMTICGQVGSFSV